MLSIFEQLAWTLRWRFISGYLSRAYLRTPILARITASTFRLEASSTAWNQTLASSNWGKVLIATKTFFPLAWAYDTPSAISFREKFRPSKFLAFVAF